MCGIAGIYCYRNAVGAVDEEKLLRIRDSMRSRGPDGAGIWFSHDRLVGLAQRRLAIIDLSEAGAQPMANANKSLQIVFNGEIYNYLELREDLKKQGYHFQSNSDTEVLLHLYSRYGQKMVDYLRGMYAIAIWDEEKQGMFLARDPFGIKPLYYTDNGNTFQFASQVKALLTGGGIDTSFDPAGHVGFLLWGHVPEPYTLYKSIRQLPAGHSIWLDRNGVRSPSSFCDISNVIREATDCPINLKPCDRSDYIRMALLDSLNHHMVADVPVGLFLSSGIDSTAMLALLSEEHKQAMRSVTLSFTEYEGTANDEAPLAEVAARQYGSLHQTRSVSRSDFTTHLPSLLSSMDQPTIDGINSYFISKVTAESGLKVALSGLGGDEIFGGYPSFQQLPRMVNIFGGFRHVPVIGKGFRWLSQPFLKSMTSSKYAGLFEYGGSYDGAYLLRRGLFMPWELPGLLDDEMIKKGWEELQTLPRLERAISGMKSSHSRVAALELTFYMRQQLLRDSDWAGMAHSLEIRVPFVDIQLLRQMAPLFGDKPSLTKKDITGTVRSLLPTEIVNRPKTGFGIPTREWMLQTVANTASSRGLKAWSLYLYRSFISAKIEIK